MRSPGYPPMGQPYMPGTLLNLYIPAGACVNLLNMVEIASPKGINLIVRVPFLANSPQLLQFLAPLLGLGGMASLLPTAQLPATQLPTTQLPIGRIPAGMAGSYPKYFHPYPC